MRSVQKMGQKRLPFPAPIMFAPTTITRNDAPTTKQPMAIFETLDGSVPRLFCHAQKRSKNGARRKMKAGFTDWNHVDDAHDGQIVFSSAHVCIVLPCCSKTAQKMMLRA